MKHWRVATCEGTGEAGEGSGSGDCVQGAVEPCLCVRASFVNVPLKAYVKEGGV